MVRIVKTTRLTIAPLSVPGEHDSQQWAVRADVA
jgi:hypothetical protein